MTMKIILTIANAAIAVILLITAIQYLGEGRYIWTLIDLLIAYWNAWLVYRALTPKPVTEPGEEKKDGGPPVSS